MTSDPLVLGFLLGLGLCVAVGLFAGLAYALYLVATHLLWRWRVARFGREVDRLEEQLAVSEAERLLEARR